VLKYTNDNSQQTSGFSIGHNAACDGSDFPLKTPVFGWNCHIIKQNDDVIKYLQKDNINLNALNYLSYAKNADVYIYNNDINNGVIIGNKEQDFFYLATNNVDFLKEFWDNLSAGHKCFTGVEKSIADVFVKDKKIVWQSPCQVYALLGEFECIENLNYKSESLITDDAVEVDKYYTFRDDDSVNSIRESIELCDSSCIRISGELAAWCLVHAEDGSMGPLFVKESYRGLGLAKIVSERLIGKLITKNITPYLHINETNNPSLSLIKKISGMAYSHDCVWFGIDKQEEN